MISKRFRNNSRPSSPPQHLKESHICAFFEKANIFSLLHHMFKNKDRREIALSAVGKHCCICLL